jgi:hypothetical protein
MNRIEYRRAPSSAWLLTSALLSFGVLGIAVPAEAAATESCGLDCPIGTTCALAPAGCPAIGCADPADCPPCDAPATPYCAPADCESDSDCGGSMLCAEQTLLDCGAAAATSGATPTAAAGDAPGATLPGSPACESSTLRQCTPRWQLPCIADADCGEGFRCEETEACSVPPFDPSSGTPPSSEVTCSPTGTFACVVVETSCNTEADCPADFVCVDNPSGACSSSSDGQTECEPADPARVCSPAVVASPVTPGDVANTASAEGASNPGTAPAVDLVGDGTDAVASASQGGCTLNGSAPASPLALLSTLGLALAFGSRRRDANRR